MDVKQGVNKEGKTILYLVFEYMDIDLKKFIQSFHQIGKHIPPNIVKVIIIIPFSFISYLFVEDKSLYCIFVLQSLMYQLCNGVAFCHGHGILHK